MTRTGYILRSVMHPFHNEKVKYEKPAYAMQRKIERECKGVCPCEK